MLVIHPVIISLSTTFIFQAEQLRVTASDDSHYQADHKSIQMNCLQLHWWLEISNLTNALLHNIHDT